MSHRVTFCIPTIPPRQWLLMRAIGSIMAQTYPVASISIAVDNFHEGAAVTRNRAWRQSTTEWVAFLDDDDELKPDHLRLLLEHHEQTGADVVYPWFDTMPPRCDPIAEIEHLPWLPDSGHIFPITTLVRRSALEHVGGFPEADAVSEVCAGEDYAMWMSMRDAGIKISHLDLRTWVWHHDNANTSGLGTRW